jgi:hypothetical protein
MPTDSIFARIADTERDLRALQSEVPVEHPAYALLGAALANVSEAAFELQER